MTAATITQCSSTAASITEVLLGGDLILNLTAQSLAAGNQARFLQLTAADHSDSRLQICSQVASVAWSETLIPLFDQLRQLDADRIVVVADQNSPAGLQAIQELSSRGIRCLLCTLMEDCGANAFMDEEDAEAVAERLRQLGYL